MWLEVIGLILKRPESFAQSITGWGMSGILADKADRTAGRARGVRFAEAGGAKHYDRKFRVISQTEGGVRAAGSHLLCAERSGEGGM